MINHHWLRIRESRTQIFNCGILTCLYCRIYVRKCQEKNFPLKYVAALFQCRSCPGVSPQRCLALILAKSYPIFWRVCTCQAAWLHITPPSPKNKKHRKMLTTQAGFLLSEDQPLTVLGSSMMLHHCLRLRDLSMGIFSYDDLVCSDYEHIFVIVKTLFLINLSQNA